MPEIVRVLVVDDSAYVRKVVSQMLERSPFIEVVGTAHDGEEALVLVEQFARAMPSPAYLCVGASESLLRVTSRFELEELGGAFVYVKRR